MLYEFHPDGSGHVMRPILESAFLSKGTFLRKQQSKQINFCYTLLVLALLYALHAGFNFDLGGKRFVSKLHIEKGIVTVELSGNLA